MVIFLLQIRVNSCIIHVAFAGVMELVDVVDSKSTAGDSVPVRVRSPAPRGRKVRFATTFFYTHGEKNSSARSLAPPFQITTANALMLGCDLVLDANLETAASILLRYFTSEQSPLCSGVFMPTTKSVGADALTCSSCQSQFLSLNIIVIFAFSYQAYSFITQQLFYYYLIRAKSNIFSVFYVIYSPFTSRMATCSNIIAASFFDHNSKKIAEYNNN